MQGYVRVRASLISFVGATQRPPWQKKQRKNKIRTKKKVASVVFVCVCVAPPGKEQKRERRAPVLCVMKVCIDEGGEKQRET